MTLLAYLVQLAANVTPTHTVPQPTWENIVPWVIGFFATVISTLLYFITNQQNKKIDLLIAKVDKMADAVYLAHRVRLLQMAADPNLHPMLKEQCESFVREIDQATAQSK